MEALFDHGHPGWIHHLLGILSRYGFAIRARHGGDGDHLCACLSARFDRRLVLRSAAYPQPRVIAHALRLSRQVIGRQLKKRALTPTAIEIVRASRSVDVATIS